MIGLFWSYFAILLALSGLLWIAACSILNKKLDDTPNTSLNLFIAALILTILEVGQSFLSTLIKLFIHDSFFYQVTTGISEHVKYVLVALAFIITVCSFFGVKLNKIKTYERFIPWIICIISIIIAVVILGIDILPI
jgi:hypothetical protein